MIKPFSQNELTSLKEFLEENDWHHEGIVENEYRYSLHKLKLLMLTVKFPVLLPFRLNIPYEIVSFKISIAFQFFHLNKNIYTVLNNLCTLLHELTNDIELNYDFPFKKKKSEFLDLLNNIFPEINTNERENTWINKIRIAQLNKREKSKINNILQSYIKNKEQPLVETINKLGLSATKGSPWELKEGIPKLRLSETLLFSNEEKFDEYFILEKEFFTYFKDLQFEKCYLRSFFETYNPYLLYSLFNEYDDYQIEKLVVQWVRFSRLLLNSLLNIVNDSGIPEMQHELIDFNYEKILQDDDFEHEENNFPFSALYHEGLTMKNLKPINRELFTVAPKSFEELEWYENYKKALKLIRDYKFNQATEILNDSLKVFNRYHQKQLTILVLFALAKIAKLLNNKKMEINYHQNALAITKSGNVPIKYIIEIHYKLGKLLFQYRDLEAAIEHFDIIITFLTNEEVEFKEKMNFLGNSYLYIGLIHLKRNEESKAKPKLKRSFEIGNTHPQVKFNYILKRAQMFKKQGYPNRALRLLKTSLKESAFEKDKFRKLRIKILLELAELSIHETENRKRAVIFLEKSQKNLSRKTIPGMKRAIRWNLLMSDYFKFLENESQKASLYLDKSRELKQTLKKLGVNI
ncbi:MAG: tetratricopeptide repeat protein [Promethearchaeia archaeon]